MLTMYLPSVLRSAVATLMSSELIIIDILCIFGNMNSGYIFRAFYLLTGIFFPENTFELIKLLVN